MNTEGIAEIEKSDGSANKIYWSLVYSQTMSRLAISVVITNVCWSTGKLQS